MPELTDDARALLAARHTEPTASAGYALVPIEPPAEAEMYVCNCDIGLGAHLDDYPDWRACYRRMVAALAASAPPSRHLTDAQLLRALHSVTPAVSPDLTAERGGVLVPSQTMRDLAAAILRESAAPLEPDVQVIDLHQLAWEQILEAAGQSKWMPPEYMVNDWVADVCSWLRGSDGPPAAPLEQKADDEMAHALRWATELASSLARKHYPEAAHWRPLPDLVGVISQIDNMTTGLVRSAAPLEPAAPERLRTALKSVIDHWNEFGPEDGFDECIERAARALAATPTEQTAAYELTRTDWQQRALDAGFKYWRAPDAHGVTGTVSQAVDLLGHLLGVEVEITAEPAATSMDYGGGPFNSRGEEAPEPAAADEPATKPKDRSPTDYALEHAEYLARSAEKLVEAVVLLAACEQRRDEQVFDEPEGEFDALDHSVDCAKNCVTEYMGAVRGDVYEFRRRRDRAALSSSPEPSAAPGAGWQPYTTAMGDAAKAYMRRFPNAHPLPAQFRWSELWRAMQSSGRCAYPQCDCEPPEHGGCGMAATREEERG